MIKESSCGAVVFRKEKGKILYLLLHYEAWHWDFPKGNQEKGEEEQETVLREIKEETGIEDSKIVSGFKHQINYKYKTPNGISVDKRVSVHLVETKTEKIKISFEHMGFEWLEHKKALERLTYKSSKELLKKADLFVNR